MVKKVFSVSFVLTVLILPGLSSQCFAAGTDALEQAKTNILAMIDSGNHAGALAACNTLVANFPADENTAGVLHAAVGRYQELQDYERAIGIAQDVEDAWSGSNQGMWFQMHIASGHVSLGAGSEADTAVQKLVSDYGSHPDLPRALYIITDSYRWSGDYEKTREICQRIVERHPTSRYAGQARLAIGRSNVLSLIGSGGYNRADQALTELTAQFADHPDMAQTLCDIAQEYSWSRQYDRAQSIYQKVVQDYPSSPVASQAQRCLQKTQQVLANILALIEAGSYREAKDGIDELIAQFGDEPDVPAMLIHAASRLEELMQYAEAKYTYQQVIWRYPGDVQTEMAEMGARRASVLSFMVSNDETSVQAALDAMVANFTNHPFLPTSLVLTAEGYYRRAGQLMIEGNEEESHAHLTRTVEVVERMMNQFPDSDEVPNACCLAADCLDKLGEHEASISYYQRVVDDYPEYHMTWRALFMIGRNLQKMGETGLIPMEEAIIGTRAAYERLIREYPDCDAAPLAERWLIQSSSQE